MLNPKDNPERVSAGALFYLRDFVNQLNLSGEELHILQQKQKIFKEYQKELEFKKNIKVDLYEDYNLTKREQETILLINKGLSIKQMSKTLNVTETAINVYIGRIYRKMNLSQYGFRQQLKILKEALNKNITKMS